MDTTALEISTRRRVTRRRERKRQTIEHLEAAMRKEIKSGDLEQTIFDGETDEGHDQCKHFFGDGVYARSMFIPAGSTVVGKIHRQDRICIIAQGRCQFVDEFHQETVEAPWIGEFKAGTKTVVYAETDTLWVAVIGTEMKDPKEILGKLSANTHTEFAMLEHDEPRRLT